MINTCGDFEKSAPKGPDGRPLMYGMFGEAMPAEAVTSIVEHRGTMWAGLQVLLGDKNFFGGDKPNIGDFWCAALLYSWERNTKGKEEQAHVCEWLLLHPGCSTPGTLLCHRGHNRGKNIPLPPVYRGMNLTHVPMVLSADAAHAKGLESNAAMTAWADRIGAELADYLAARSGGTI